MTHELQMKANELIRALGALGVAQERRAGLDDISDLTRQAVDLKEALISAHPDSQPSY